MSLFNKVTKSFQWGDKTVILETGDAIVASLNVFAQAHEPEAASFKAIGALSGATLAFFDWAAKEYLPKSVEEQVGVASLTGDIATA